MAVERIDSRRLTGANLHAQHPGAVLELRFGCADPDTVIDGWRAALAAGLAALGWSAQTHVRRFVDAGGRAGAELMFTARLDRLYAATDLNEWALAVATHELIGDAVEARLSTIAQAAAAAQAARRGAVELVAAAQARGVMALVDDDELSLGQYADVQRWPIGALPQPDAVAWASFVRRPLALITGTNGKTTTTRLLARILAKHGLRVGNTSTDGLCVGERLIESGDWTGPGGARAIVRRPDIDVALLETARGGLLRRGAGVPWADVAVITNVAADHLGEFGIFDLAGMAAAKGIVAKVVAADGRIVLGAESPALVAWASAQTLPAPIVWFALDPEHPVLAAARARGDELWTVLDGAIARVEGDAVTTLCPIAAMPLSLAGRARYNVANALAAAAAARGLGVADATITAALTEFGAAPEDNPGRARLWRIELGDTSEGEGRAARVFVDFAHNLAGLAAIEAVVAGLAAEYGPLALAFGMAGDRSDDELRALGAALTRFAPTWVLLREQPDYLRGRGEGEVPLLLDEGLRAAGFDPARIVHTRDEVDAIERAIAAGAGVVVILVHTQREAVGQWLRAHHARLESPS